MVSKAHVSVEVSSSNPNEDTFVIINAGGLRSTLKHYYVQSDLPWGQLEGFPTRCCGYEGVFLCGQLNISTTILHV
jgi:hypothetical protein